MKKRLKKAIIIPAGTIFDDSPRKTMRRGEHVDAVIALTSDMTGIFSTALEAGDEKEWFENLRCGDCPNWRQKDEQYGQCIVTHRHTSKDSEVCVLDEE